MKRKPMWLKGSAPPRSPGGISSCSLRSEANAICGLMFEKAACARVKVLQTDAAASARLAQRDAANLFLAREWIFNRQLRVVAITPAPKSAHGLLASVDHFCK